ncbi:modification methylase [Halobacteriales archaeon SW_5_70_135]|nr:MAG: modification methylase [Halobacteriales archaeon SW_5_70_135]
METDHEVVVGDARDLASLPDDSVELVVTSPPYPMIELWDETFAALDDGVADALAAGEGERAFESMHAVLDAVWDEVARVLVKGGVACVNVGDATRTLDRFRVYHNHARVAAALAERGLEPLPDVVWRKPANSAAKFMGSGTLPPNAYVTLEHEYVLVFRNGPRRSFEPGAEQRYGAAYFWEERNEWFSDVWTDVRGVGQDLDDAARERSGAYPFEIPYRLVCMYSVYGDRVLDPFWGTGTTTLAAMAAGRDSVGVEIDPELVEAFEDRVERVPDLSRRVVERRLREHAVFVKERRAAGDPPAYEATRYDTRVVTEGERAIRLYAVNDVEATESAYVAIHEPVASMPDG